jgi:predicted kinase
MKVIVMQGLPGSGKSTWIKNNCPGAVVCSADHYFTDRETGEYKFDPTKIGEAHKECLRAFLDATEAEEDLVVVDNTNLSLWEMATYIQVAAARGYTVEVVRIMADPGVCAQRNVHGVPLKTILQMADRMEQPLFFWPCKVKTVCEKHWGKMAAGD